MATQIKSYVCQKKCFFRNRVWLPGETLQPHPNEVLPKHFVDKGAYKPDVKKIPPTDPKSLAEWSKREQEEARRAVGHGMNTEEIAGMPAVQKNAEGAAVTDSVSQAFS